MAFPDLDFNTYILIIWNVIQPLYQSTFVRSNLFINIIKVVRNEICKHYDDLANILLVP